MPSNNEQITIKGIYMNVMNEMNNMNIIPLLV